MPEPIPRRILITAAGVTSELTPEEVREALARVTAERDYCRDRWTYALGTLLVLCNSASRDCANTEAESRVAAAMRELRKAHAESPVKGE